jgi:hypothetical protein
VPSIAFSRLPLVYRLVYPLVYIPIGLRDQTHLKWLSFWVSTRAGWGTWIRTKGQIGGVVKMLDWHPLMPSAPAAGAARQRLP